jgi:hypothetical protein
VSDLVSCSSYCLSPFFLELFPPFSEWHQDRIKHGCIRPLIGNQGRKQHLTYGFDGTTALVRPTLEHGASGLCICRDFPHLLAHCRTRTIPTYHGGSVEVQVTTSRSPRLRGRLVYMSKDGGHPGARDTPADCPLQLPTDIRFGCDHGRVVRELVAPNTVEWNGCQSAGTRQLSPDQPHPRHRSHTAPPFPLLRKCQQNPS